MKGLVHIYTGNGKGKTTAAIGLGIRAYGRGFKVLMVQFMKGRMTGEIKTLKMLEPDFRLKRGEEIKKFTWQMERNELNELSDSEQKMLEDTAGEVSDGKYQMLILDEIINSVSCGLIPAEKIVDFIKNKPDDLEVIMTGRNAPPELMEVADYITEMKEIRHPFNKGVPARKGIEN
jgi:cob(I)alamin adenosyltransferase